MSEPWEWIEADLERLVHDQTSESLTLEYKAIESLQNNNHNKFEISKDASAFANSAGGTIVYGIDEQGHLPVAIRGVDPMVTTREWLEQVINSGIRRRIDGIRINQISLNSADPGHVAYVVNIPQSLRAAHQVSDHRFYKRFNFQSVPMEEYEIRDASRREDLPDLRLEFDLWPDPNGAPLNFNGQAQYSEPVPFITQVVNRSSAMALYALIALAIDVRLQAIHVVGRRWPEDYHLHVENAVIQCARYTMNWSPQNRMPIWQGSPLWLDETPLSIRLPRQAGTYYMSWKIWSPGMASSTGVVTLVSNGHNVVMG